jgi:hypothetical protein
MGFQTLLTLLLVAIAAGFLGRKLFRTARGEGCASGCGSCGSRTCALRKLEAELKAAAKPRH